MQLHKGAKRQTRVFADEAEAKGASSWNRLYPQQQRAQDAVPAPYFASNHWWFRRIQKPRLLATLCALSVQSPPDICEPDVGVCNITKQRVAMLSVCSILFAFFVMAAL